MCYSLLCRKNKYKALNIDGNFHAMMFSRVIEEDVNIDQYSFVVLIKCIVALSKDTHINLE